jgi:hypothetical protein
MTYPTIQKTGALKEVLKKIEGSGIPQKFTTQHLKTLGFTSSNDQRIVGALKFIGFIDGSGVPTDKYKAYRGKDGAKILGESIKTGYAELFQLYPDAHLKDEESLRHFFATNTDVGESALKAMIATFKAFCSVANFELSSMGMHEVVSTGDGLSVDRPKSISKSKDYFTPAININIELQIPPTNDPEVYKNFFEAMKKYLLTE